MVQANVLDSEENLNDWTVPLLRSIIQGDVDVVERVVLDHLETLNTRFTTDMDDWKIQWETPYWWQIQTAGVVFVASLFGQPKVLQWLLEHGADRSLQCYLGQNALDLAGECCTEEAKIEECKYLLSEPAKIPSSPTLFRFEKHILSNVETHLKEEHVENAFGEVSVIESVDQVDVHKCTLHVYWYTPLSNGAIIESHQIRYRLAQAKGGTNVGVKGWTTITVQHARRRLEQAANLSGLEIEAEYQVNVRSKNATGFGLWSEAQIVHTPDRPIASSNQTA